jgi:hypothetical protein
VQETNIGGQIDYRLPVQLKEQTQHTVRTGVLRSHAEQQVLFGIVNLHAGANFGSELFYR